MRNILLALGGVAMVALSAAGLWGPNQPTPATAGAPSFQIRQGQVVTPGEFRGDVRSLPQLTGAPEGEPPPRRQAPALSTKQALPGAVQPQPLAPSEAVVASMPTPAQNFAGLSRTGSCTGGPCGAGWPPDTNGDVGPNNYMQAVNTSIGIFSKTGVQQAAFTFNSFWASAGTGTPCDNSNQGDPIVLYDPLADRFIFMDFAWYSADANTGPFYFCFAVSKTSDPVAGGYWYYAIRGDDDAHPWLPDYPKGAVWPDGLYFSANMFDMNTDQFQEVRVWAFNRQQMEAGQSLQSVVVDLNSTNYFTLLPSNLHGAQPPAGTPNYFVTEDWYSWAYDVFKFHVVYGGAGSSFTAVPTQVYEASYSVLANDTIVPQPGGTSPKLDALYDRLMMQNQYRNIGGTESLWVARTFRGSPGSNTGIQWAQINVTGGTVANAPVQEQQYSPDATLYRWMPSLAVDKQGNMAVGYSVSSSSVYPGIRYAGRLSTDALNTLGQGESTLVDGSGSQTSISRWGDYSAMTVDPADDCTFWYTNEYYTASGNNWNTRIGSFSFPACIATLSTATPTAAATDTPTPTATGTATPTPTATVTATGTATPTATSTATPTPTATGTATATVTATGTATPDLPYKDYLPVISKDG